MSSLRLFVHKGINRRAAAVGPEIPAPVRPAARRGRHCRYGRSGMWRAGNMMLAPLIACLAMALPALGQGGGAATSQIEPADALRTFAEVSEWLDAWETPTDAQLPRGCVGVWVAIRLAGRPVGAGSGIDANSLDTPSSRALTGAARRAMAAALDTAGGVTDADIRADKQEQFLASPFRTLELDLAHSPERIRATSLDRVLESIRPGLDGLLLRREGQTYSVFPAEMLAFDTRPSSAIVALLSRSGAPTESLDREIGDGTIRIWRFQTVHLAQATRDGAAAFLYRGSRAVPLQSIDVAEIRTMAHETAGYLRRSTIAIPDQPGYLLLLGDYLPQVDRRLQDRATLADHALAALALLKYAAIVESSDSAAARSSALALLSLLGYDEATRLAVGQDARAAALTHLAIEQLQPAELTPALSELSAAVDAGIERAFRPDRGFSENLSPEDRALVAAALGTRQAIDAAWVSVGPAMQPLLMPWLAMAEVEQARSGRGIPSLPALRALRQRVLAEQPGYDPGQIAEPDMIGALKYRAAMDPDWRAAHLVTYSAVMLSDSQCTPPQERPEQIINLQRSLRFLRQLQVRDADRYRTRNPETALGGVRTGVCDQTMPVAASAATLLAAVSTLEAFEQSAGGGQ